MPPISRMCLRILMYIRLIHNLEFQAAHRIPKQKLYVCSPHIRCMSSQENRSLFNINQDKDKFHSYYPEFKKKVIEEYSETFDDSRECIKLEKLMDYNLTSNRQTASLKMIQLYKSLATVSEKHVSLENEDLFTIGWLLGMLLAPGYLLDDVVDLSTHRRGIPCWHTFENNEKTLPFDVVKLNLLTFRLFDRHYGDRSFHKNISKLLHQNILRTYMAETMDAENRILMGTDEIPGYYYKLCFGKALYYLQIPMNTAIYLAGYENELKMDALTEVQTDLGCLAQALNDYIDIYGTTSKDGTTNEPICEDIKSGRVTWFLEYAMVHANSEQKETIKKHYGCSKADSVQEIIRVYNDLGLEDQFHSFNEELQKRIKRRAKNFPIYIELMLIEMINTLTRMKDKSFGKMEKRENSDV